MKLTPLDAWIAGKVEPEGGPVSRTAIQAYQLHRLHETLALAREKSPFYRRHLAAAPDDLSALVDLAWFPFTTARHVAENALQFLCVSQGDIQRVVTLDSSGTTGPPKRLYFTRDDQELTIDFFRVGMSTLVEPGDRVLILLPGERPGSVGDLLAIGLERLGVRGIKHGPVHDVAETLQVLAREEANALVGIPVQVLALARYRDERGAPVPLRLKSVLLSTDYVSPAIVSAVEHAWACRVFNHYGMTEMGLGGGVECEARRGYHLREADLYVEIVDPHSGEPLAEGEKGEVVFTTLTRRGMPLIRYRTGDLSRFVPAPCACGTALKVLEPVRERISGRVALGCDQSLSMADLDDALFPLEAVLDLAAAVTRRAEGDCLALTAFVAPGARDAVSASVLQAVDAVPAVAQARLAARLDVALVVQEIDNRSLRAPAKRMIADRGVPVHIR